MRRGTTPTINVSIDHVDLSLMAGIIITLSQNGAVVIEKTGDDIAYTDGTASITLTQEETLRLERGYVDIQIKAKTSDGKVWATKIKQRHVDEILEESVMA